MAQEYPDLVLLAAHEAPDDEMLRSAMKESGAVWSTRVGITIGDASRTVRGRGWYAGLGEWVSPRGRHPVPIGLEIYLRVCGGPAIPNGPGTSGISSPCLVVDEFSLDAVSSYVEKVLAALRSPVGELVSVLRDFFVVNDPDE